LTSFFRRKQGSDIIFLPYKNCPRLEATKSPCRVYEYFPVGL
jgi:hypothetical protein